MFLTWRLADTLFAPTGVSHEAIGTLSLQMAALNGRTAICELQMETR